MATGIIVAIIVAVVIVAGLAIGTGPVARRRGLRKRFGPEYDRAVTEHQSRRLAETELAGRERRVRQFELRDLTAGAREKYEADWTDVQEQFVEAPADAVAAAQRLVESVMGDTGYPAAEYDQAVADLSVRHARTIEHYRLAHRVSEKAVTGQASTEELRVTMLGLRDLFSELLGGGTQPGRAVTPAIAGQAQYR